MTTGCRPETQSDHRRSLAADLRELGIRPGDLLMVHASLKAIGPVEGGPQTIVAALLDAIEPGGTLMAYVSWDHSPYDETLNGRALDAASRNAWPAFDPKTAGIYPGFGMLNTAIAGHPEVQRSGHPDASIAAIGPLAAYLVDPHPLDSAYGPGSPLERFVEANGRVLLLGAPPDALTILHYAEAIADIPHKRRVTYEMPVLDDAGKKRWVRAEDFDSNGILDCYAESGGPDAVELIGRAYLRTRNHPFGRVGNAVSDLLDAADLVEFGRRWLEERHRARTST